MELYLLDALGRKSGIVNEFTSLQWNRRYMEAGSFVLHCPTRYSTMFMRDDVMLWPTGDAEAGMVESMDFQLDSAGKETLAISGRLCTGILTVRFETWGVSADVRLTEIQEVTETGATSVYAVFGKDAWLPLEQIA